MTKPKNDTAFAKDIDSADDDQLTAEQDIADSIIIETIDKGGPPVSVNDWRAVDEALMARDIELGKPDCIAIGRLQTKRVRAEAIAIGEAVDKDLFGKASASAFDLIVHAMAFQYCQARFMDAMARERSLVA